MPCEPWLLTSQPCLDWSHRGGGRFCWATRPVPKCLAWDAVCFLPGSLQTCRFGEYCVLSVVASMTHPVGYPLYRLSILRLLHALTHTCMHTPVPKGDLWRSYWATWSWLRFCLWGAHMEMGWLVPFPKSIRPCPNPDPVSVTLFRKSILANIVS